MAGNNLTTKNYYVVERYNDTVKKWEYFGVSHPTRKDASLKTVKTLNAHVKPLGCKYRLVRCVTIQEYYK